MNRKLLVSLHLYLAAFFTPMILLVAITGGLYLFGIKGNVERTVVATLEQQTLNLKQDDLNAYASNLLQQAGVEEHRFEYLKTYGNEAVTRPTSRTHYQFKQTDAGIEVARMEPNLQAAMMELHKGHGPGLFKWLEKFLAIALVFVMLSGLLLGLQSPMLKVKTLALSAAGVAVALAAMLL